MWGEGGGKSHTHRHAGRILEGMGGGGGERKNHRVRTRQVQDQMLDKWDMKEMLAYENDGSNKSLEEDMLETNLLRRNLFSFHNHHLLRVEEEECWWGVGEKGTHLCMVDCKNLRPHHLYTHT